MTLYRFPDALGGGEHEGSKNGVLAEFNLPGLDEALLLPLSVLTEVKPDVPPEPPMWTIAQVGHWLIQRRDNRDAMISWYDLERKTWLTWEQVWAEGDVVLYMPVPKVELPANGTLFYSDPWTVSRVKWMVTIETLQPDLDLSPDQAKAMALALLTAAEAAS